jgi:hypothetical protein
MSTRPGPVNPALPFPSVSLRENLLTVTQVSKRLGMSQQWVRDPLAMPYLRQIAARFNLTATATLQRGAEAVIIAKVEVFSRRRRWSLDRPSYRLALYCPRESTHLDAIR